MKKLKRLIAVISSLALVIVLVLPVNAATNESTAINKKPHDICYTVYNEKNEVVEEGVIPGGKARYGWSGSITLKNGWYTAFKQSNNNAFYITSGTIMDFTYHLNRNATIEYYFYKDSSPNTAYSTTWRSGTMVGAGANLSQRADANKYYYVGITNASSDPITISNVSFVF